MTEPFPPLNGTTSGNSHNPSDNIRQRRRKSSALGADIRGDVDVPSFATARKGTPPLNSPANFDMSVRYKTLKHTPPRLSATFVDNEDRNQTNPPAAQNRAPSAALSPNSAANAFDTHGSAP
jgi:hypothetical protein